jgi:arginyl-tRNA synthetase
MLMKIKGRMQDSGFGIQENNQRQAMCLCQITAKLAGITKQKLSVVSHQFSGRDKPGVSMTTKHGRLSTLDSSTLLEQTGNVDENKVQGQEVGLRQLAGTSAQSQERFLTPRLVDCSTPRLF